MPITLVTGLPGHGKTLYTLARWKHEAEQAGRPVFHNGIKGLNIPGWQEWDAQKWGDLPPNSLMVIDECQFVFPVRGRGQPPEWIERLATHRHLGLDFVIITQNPMLMDSFVRRLVDRHFHVVRKFGTHSATIHEFPNGCNENVSKSREGSIRHEWRYPKKVFEWYTSAEVHTVKRRIPARVWLLLSIPFILGALVWYAYSRLNPEAAAARMGAEPAQQTSGPGGTAAPLRSGPGAGPPVNQPMTQRDYVAQHVPRIEGLPHTAPRYDEVTKPVTAPVPAACIMSATRCQCYTHQATRMHMEEDLCRQLAERGYFVDFAINALPQGGQGPAVLQAPPPQALPGTAAPPGMPPMPAAPPSPEPYPFRML